jgi:hypothetical protein
VVEFASTDIGFQIGVLHIRSGNRIEMEYSDLVRSSPSLLKLLGE